MEKTVTKPAWFNEIRDEILKRDHKCKLQGPSFVMELQKNPYSYRSYSEFLRYHPYKNKEKEEPKCVYKHRTVISKRTDKKGRYYKDNIRSKEECSIVDGVWDPKSLNRENKYGTGVCWTNDSEQQCASLTNENLLTPELRDSLPNLASMRDMNKGTCNLSPTCNWDDELTDCMAKNKPKTFENHFLANLQPASDPPKNIPFDITTEDAKIQNYLYNWYNLSLPNIAPKTDQLFGTGNRCVEGKNKEVGQTKKADDNNDFVKFHMYTKQELKTIPFPLKGDHIPIMKAAIGPPNVVILSQLHHQLKQKEHMFKNHPKNPDYSKQMEENKNEIETKWNDITDLYKGVDDIEDYDNYYKYDENAIQQVTEKQYLPSFSQSIVNMLMKKIAMDTSTNRGIVCWHSTGSGKCHAKNTKILMFDGSIKLVQDIVVGDNIMGDDSTSRKVLSLGTGTDDMYDIIPTKGEKYTVNSEHILCLKPESFSDEDKIVEVAVKDYLNLAPSVKQQLKGYRHGVEFPSREVDIDPWIIGFWIGKEVIEHELSDKILQTLHKYDMINKKHIPDIYKINDKEKRLQLLAGIIDSDGYLHDNCYEIIQKSKHIADDILYLCRSLGFAAYSLETNDSNTYEGKTYTGIYQCISISGEGLENIPTKLARKKSQKCLQIKNALLSSIEVKHVGKDNYYGFTLDGNHRYLMGDFTVTHNTCTAGGVIDAFWDTNKQIIFTSSKDAIASNPPINFHTCVARLFPRFAQQPYNKDLDLIKEGFEKRNINFLSFAELANRIERMEKIRKDLKIPSKPLKLKVAGGKPETKIDTLVNFIAKTYGVTKESAKAAAQKANARQLSDIVDLDNCVLIMDEVHNLFRPISNQKKLYSKVEHHIINPNVHPNLKVVILTATPGDNVTDAMKLINAVRDPTHPLIKQPNPENAQDVMRFKHDIRGIVSYFDMSGDTTKFPVVYDNGPVKYPMSANQFATYVEKYKEVTEGMKNYDKLAKDNQLAKYWQGARKYSNMLFSFDKTMQLTEFSSKLPALLEKIQLYPKEKQYCYSAFYTNQGTGHGILEIGRQMEALGYKKLTVKEAKEVNKSGKQLPPAKRYILAIQKEIGEEGSVSAGNNLHEMLRIYNSEANKNGDIVHMLLASQGFNEGLDLKDVRHIHIFEPLVTMASDLQTIGRARRFCSHAHLNQSDWTVQIHRYLTDFPSSSSKNKQDIEMEITGALGRIGEMEDKLKALPPAKKGTDNASVKQLLKEKITSEKADLNLLKKSLKKQVSSTDIKNIDEFIYTEAQNKMKDLFTIYHCMKESAVDCEILHKFHNNKAIHCLDS